MNTHYQPVHAFEQHPVLSQDTVIEASLDSIVPLTQLWALRILVLLGGSRSFMDERGFNQPALAQYLGFSALVLGNDYTQAQAQYELRQLYQYAELTHAQQHWQVIDDLHANIVMLQDILGLSPIECQILGFIIVLHTERLLDDAADLLGSMSAPKAIKIVSIILKLPYEDVRLALSAQGNLIRSGLVIIERSYPSQLRNKFEFISEQLADKMLVHTAQPMELFASIISKSPAAELDLQDYSHLDASLDLLLPYLRQAFKQQQSGVNIFLYGVAGTGKSQLARVVAQALSIQLYEISSQDHNGDAITATGRLCAYRAAQSIFSNKPALLVFDEIEDVFNDTEGGAGVKSTAQSRKAWINRMLESNAVPTFWISNSDDLDAAFIRRFDLVIEVKIPPKKQRQQLIAQQYSGLLSEHCQTQLAHTETLAPAILQRAYKVLKTVHHEDSDLNADATMLHLVSSTLMAQGHAAIRSSNIDDLPAFYDIDFIQTTANLIQISQGLKQHNTGRLCLYGPSGTGKTAFARWLAETLDKPLLIKRGSDILSKWLGEMEKNLASAFYQAEQQQAILLLDEVDSLLLDRRDARHSWEISQVNEFLTQLESYSGIVIATTNRFEHLDQAALRRFDFKLHFDYLKYNQRLALITQVADLLNISFYESDIQARLQGLNKLTSGDFAVINRQALFHPFSNIDMLLDHLEQEVILKGHSISKMGFTQ